MERVWENIGIATYDRKLRRVLIDHVLNDSLEKNIPESRT